MIGRLRLSWLVKALKREIASLATGTADQSGYPVHRKNLHMVRRQHCGADQVALTAVVEENWFGIVREKIHRRRSEQDKALPLYPRLRDRERGQFKADGKTGTTASFQPAVPAHQVEEQEPVRDAEVLLNEPVAREGVRRGWYNRLGSIEAGRLQGV